MRTIRKRWYLLLIPAAVAAMPLLFFVMATGTRVLSIFTGPINIWNTPAHNPAAGLVGEYKLSNKSVAYVGVGGEYFSRTSTITLRKDRSVQLVDVPSYDGFGDSVECLFNAQGTWKIGSSSFGSELELNLESSPPVRGVASCGSMNFSMMYVLGRYPPYRIWYVVGDPDSDTGLSYVRQQ